MSKLTFQVTLSQSRQRIKKKIWLVLLLQSFIAQIAKLFVVLVIVSDVVDVAVEVILVICPCWCC